MLALVFGVEDLRISGRDMPAAKSRILFQALRMMNAIDSKSRTAKRVSSRNARRVYFELAPGLRMKSVVTATALALVSLPVAHDAAAQSIGELDVRSRVGERFFAVAPVEGMRGPP